MRTTRRSTWARSGSCTSTRHTAASVSRRVRNERGKNEGSSSPPPTDLAYCLWAFEGSAAQQPSGWTALSAVPFVLGIMRYGLVPQEAKGEDPQDVVMSDRVLQVIGLVWVALLIVGVVG